MTTVVIDAAAGDKLLAAGDQVEVRDESGRLIGWYVRTKDGPPASPPKDDPLADWPTTEELNRRVREDKRYTTEEVLAHLRRFRNEG